MIERVYNQAKKSKALSKVVVATEHKLIFDHVVGFGGEACMTAEHHPSGTDRCYEALTLQHENFDYTINIQGDEPFIEPGQIDLLASYLDGKTQLATLIKKIDTLDQLHSNSEVKVTFNTRNEALYFSRAIIPFLQKIEERDWLKAYDFYKHVGMYAYRADILREITKLAVSPLEKAESLEQLRWQRPFAQRPCQWDCGARGDQSEGRGRGGRCAGGPGLSRLRLGGCRSRAPRQ